MEELIQKNAEQATENQPPELKPFPTSYPGGITPETLFDARTEKIIAAQADKLICTGLFQQFERDDIANELRIVLAYEMADFDPSKNRYTFAATILAKRGINFILHRKVEINDGLPTLSLDAPAHGDATFADLMSEEEYREAWGSSPVKEEVLERRDKALKAMLKTISPLDLTICQNVMDGKTFEEIGEIVGMQKSGVRKRLIRTIRPIAIQFGLAKSAAEEGGDEE